QLPGPRPRHGFGRYGSPLTQVLRADDLGRSDYLLLCTVRGVGTVVGVRQLSHLVCGAQRNTGLPRDLPQRRLRSGPDHLEHALPTGCRVDRPDAPVTPASHVRLWISRRRTRPDGANGFGRDSGYLTD